MYKIINAQEHIAAEEETLAKLRKLRNERIIDAHRRGHSGYAISKATGLSQTCIAKILKG